MSSRDILKPISEMPDNIDFGNGYDCWGQYELGEFFISRILDSNLDRDVYRFPAFLNHVIITYAKQKVEEKLCEIRTVLGI